MRSLPIFILSIMIMSGSAYSQLINKTILIVVHGEAPNEQEAEILKYYAERGHHLDWMTMEDICSKGITPANHPLVWIHGSDPSKDSGSAYNHLFIEAILKYVEGDGSLLLTQQAMEFLNQSGLESTPVRRKEKASEDNGYGRMLGFHSFISHPAFDGLNGGSYIWKPPQDTTIAQYGFFFDEVPVNGKVVAVDWDYIFVREETKLIVEYKYGKGKIIGIGAYFNLYEPNLNRMHYDRFYENVFAYLLDLKEGEADHYWLYGDRVIKRLDAVFMKQFIPPPAIKWDLESNDLTLKREKARHEYCEASGKRILLAAYEPAGIFEVWAHPFMAFSGYRASLYIGDTIINLDKLVPEKEISPGAIVRKYTYGGIFTLTEVISVAPARPTGVIHYEYAGPKGWLAIQYKSNMRLMWPYSGDVLKTYEHGYDPAFNAIVFSAPEAELSVMVGANKQSVSKYSGMATDPEPEFKLGESIADDAVPKPDSLFSLMAGQLYELQEKDILDVVFACGSEGISTTRSEYMDAMHDPSNIFVESKAYYEKLGGSKLSIISPDENFNMGYAWALAATDKFFVETPGLGTSLVAGYNGSDRGWDGGHKVNGRPGYAWYFGRDGVWSAFAVLDYGDHEGVKNVLNMLIKYQDLNGKIFHELSTSGFVHYDASDATPLFIILAGRYLAYSGDTAYLRSIWPAVNKAIDYCKSTDTDGDGLIENTNVGHGWVEGGYLFGSHTSLYLASCWAEALAEGAYMSEKLGFSDKASQYREESREVLEKINTSFYDPATDFMYQGLFSDGTYHTGESILPSVPIYFGQIPKEKTGSMLEAYSSAEYTSDWGVRIAPTSSPYYHPAGYHSGSVWPLFTGWVSLAEYKQNRPVQGFMHVMNNLNIYRDFSLGYLEEVLNGEKYKPSGVCPHQCWSETMVLQPLIEGMLGLQPDAIKNRLIFCPSIPYEWNEISVSNIIIGDKSISWSMERAKHATHYHFSSTASDTCHITFGPCFMEGTAIRSVSLNGINVPLEACMDEYSKNISLTFDLSEKTEVIVKHNSGIGLAAPDEKPLPNESSSAIRIIGTDWDGEKYCIVTEGAPGMQYELKAINHIGKVRAVSGASYRQEGDTLWLELAFSAMNKGYKRQRIEITF